MVMPPVLLFQYMVVVVRRRKERTKLLGEDGLDRA